MRMPVRKTYLQLELNIFIYGFTVVDSSDLADFDFLLVFYKDLHWCHTNLEFQHSLRWTTSRTLGQIGWKLYHLDKGSCISVLWEGTNARPKKIKYDLKYLGQFTFCIFLIVLAMVDRYNICRYVYRVACTVKPN